MYLITVYSQADKQYLLDKVLIERDNQLGFLLFQFTDLSAEGRRIFKQEVEDKGEASQKSSKGNYDVTVKKYNVTVEKTQ